MSLHVSDHPIFKADDDRNDVRCRNWCKLRDLCRIGKKARTLAMLLMLLGARANQVMLLADDFPLAAVGIIHHSSFMFCFYLAPTAYIQYVLRRMRYVVSCLRLLVSRLQNVRDEN